MIRQLKQYIKDTATCYFISDVIKVPNTSDVTLKIKKRAIAMIKNYCSLRLKLLQNSTIEQIEIKAAQALIKSAIKSAAKEFDLELPENIDNYVDKVTEPILEYVHEERGKIFTQLLEIADREGK